MKSLIYTIALDPPDSDYHQFMVRLLVSSITSSGFDGDVLVITNSKERLFKAKRIRIREVSLPPSITEQQSFATTVKSLRYRASKYFNPLSYDKIMYVDCDCLFIRNPATLLAYHFDLMYSQDSWKRLSSPWHLLPLAIRASDTFVGSGPNDGFWWVRAGIYNKLMAHVERAMLQTVRELPSNTDLFSVAWTQVLIETSYQIAPIPLNSIRSPEMEKLTLGQLDKATLLHFTGSQRPLQQKLSHMIGVFTATHNPQIAKALLLFNCSF